MEITDQQRRRAEANRLAALAKREARLRSSNAQPPPQLKPNPNPDFPSSVEEPETKFRARLEISSPDSFAITPVSLRGFPFPGQVLCLRILEDCLSNVIPSHYTQNLGGRKACVYKLRDYSAVTKALKGNKSVEIEDIPWATLNVIERLSHSTEVDRWIPFRPEHLSDEKVDEAIEKLPKSLLEVLLPFQLDGLRYGLRRGGRCLIADEMGLGKTLQAIAIACCFLNEGPVLVVCPAILRFSWAEELERWVPSLLPSDIHLVFGHQNNPAHLKSCPKVVVISYTMLYRLRKSMLERDWALLIVDESHHIRCTKKASEPGETKTVIDMATKVKHVVLLSGTPSLSRPFDIFHQINMLWPGLLGKNKYEFAKTYCDSKVLKGVDGNIYQDFSKGIRLVELNVLLKQTVMIRRLKEYVMLQLPPKRRQIIRVSLKRADIAAAKAAVGQKAGEISDSEDVDESDDGEACSTSGKLSDQEVGIAKLSGFREWLSIHPVIAESDGATDLDSSSTCCKMIIFAHHHRVLNGLQEFISEKGIGFVRIDGTTLARDRQSAVLSFQSSTDITIAIIGITAGGVGLDFSSAQHVVFLELPQSPALMLQAEDRAHRRGQKNAVNIYIFCAKDTVDESHWQSLNKSLRRVSCTTNGKYDALQEIEVEGISFLESCETGILKDKIENPENTEHVELATPSSLNDTTREAHDEMVDEEHVESGEKCSIGSVLSKTERCHIEADVMSGSSVDKDTVSEAELEDNSSPSNNGERCALKMNEDVVCFPEREEEVGSVKVDEHLRNLVDSLRFEVSQYTARIHLYSCVPGEDARPRPLFVNFRPEELEPVGSLGPEKPRNSDNIKDDLSYRSAVLAFSTEWDNLRPVERRKLIGKPLQLPLAVELCYLNEGINHKNGGLLKIGSKRRRTPLDEISQALPGDAVWKSIRLRSGSRKKENEYTQGWSSADEPLCKLCQSPCKSSNAKSPEFFEDLFCKLDCYEEYRIRTSNRSLRQELFQLEHGVCTNCRLDCHKLVVYLRPLSLAKRKEHIEKVAPGIAMQKKLLEKLVSDPREGNAWHADHIVPVYRGGGECNLENMRTLCVACHSEVTKAQSNERRVARVKAKKQLKDFMNGLKQDRDNQQTDTSVKIPESSATQDVIEDMLSIMVPGSAYAFGSVKCDKAGDCSTSTDIPVYRTTNEL